MKRQWFIYQRVMWPSRVMDSAWLPIRPAYLRPDGGVCRIDEVGWRTWSGFCVRLPGQRLLWVYFRRGSQ